MAFRREFSERPDPFSDHYADIASNDPNSKLRILALKRLRDRMMGGGVKGSPKSIVYPTTMLGYRDIEPRQRAALRQRQKAAMIT